MSEKTVRPATIPFRCRVRFHPWPKWQPVNIRRTTAAGDSWTEVGQERICPGCGISKIRATHG